MKKIPFLSLTLVLLVLSGCASTREEPLHVEIEETPAPVVETIVQVTDKSCRVLFRNEVYEGKFTGTMENEVPTEGTFTGQGLYFQGTFEDGDPQNGSITAGDYYTEFDGEKFGGTIEGVLTDGELTGEVRFTSRTAQSVEFVYTGKWSNGNANGKGSLVFQDENRYDRIGTFVSGYFAPSGTEILQTLGTLEPCFSLTQEQLDYLNTFPELWEEDNGHDHYFDSTYEIDYTRLLNSSFQTKELPEQWIQQTAMRVVAWQSTELGARNIPVTVITAALDNGYQQVVWIICPGTVENLWRGAPFNALVYPLAFSEYTTVNGEPQNCIVVLASDWYF